MAKGKPEYLDDLFNLPADEQEKITGERLMKALIEVAPGKFKPTGDCNGEEVEAAMKIAGRKRDEALFAARRLHAIAARSKGQNLRK